MSYTYPYSDGMLEISITRFPFTLKLLFTTNNKRLYKSGTYGEETLEIWLPDMDRRKRVAHFESMIRAAPPKVVIRNSFLTKVSIGTVTDLPLRTSMSHDIAKLDTIPEFDTCECTGAAHARCALDVEEIANQSSTIRRLELEITALRWIISQNLAAITGPQESL